MTRAAAVAVGGLALALAGFTFDATELFVPGVAFAALGLATPAWIRLAARGATVERRLHADRVVEDEPLEATIEVTRGPWGLPGGALLDPLAARPVALSGWLSLFSGGRTANVRVVARFSRRGRVSVEPPFLIVRDPLELARTRQGGDGEVQHVLVLPRTEPVHWIGRDLARLDASQGHAPAEPQAAADVDGLRPYRPGTPASRIHWPALARGAGLLERRMRADGDTLPLVVLDARCAGQPEDLDAAVRAAASLVLELARRSGCGLLLPGERRPIEIDSNLTAWAAAHTRLALVEAGNQAPILASGVRQGRVFYVAAQPVERLPSTLVHGGRCAGVLVLPAALGSRMPQGASFEVTGCRGYVLAGRHRARDRAAEHAA